MMLGSLSKTVVSTHMPLARHDPVRGILVLQKPRFLLTCLLRGMTGCRCHLFFSRAVSTHMPLARHDGCTHAGIDEMFVSTHMPLARHDGVLPRLSWAASVSTHMPLARHDILCWIVVLEVRVSTHMPLARHDLYLVPECPDNLRFLLTCLLRGMTRTKNFLSRYRKFLLTCLLRGMTKHRRVYKRVSAVSTHMPLARHDLRAYDFTRVSGSFYSHASCEA